MTLRGALCATLFALPFACSETLGLELKPRGAFADVPCGTCIDEQCSAEADACASDPDCANLYACVAGCAADDVACRGRCEGQYAGAKQLASWQAYASCERNSCTADCVAPLFVEAACAGCVEQSCNAEREACTADATCAPLFACMAGCPLDDWSCRADCEKLHPQAVHSAVFESYDGCRRAACIDPCLGIALPVPYKDPGCAECLAADAECQDLARSCVGEAVCERMQVCIRDGEDPNSVWNDCYYELFPYPASETSVVAQVFSCWDNCPTECRIGQHWDCVGEWTHHTLLDGDRILVDVVAARVLNGDPISGATVDVCSGATPPNSDCIALVAAQTTEDIGHAKIEIPIGVGGFDGHLRIDQQGFRWYDYWWLPRTQDAFWMSYLPLNLGEFEDDAKAIAPGFVAEPGFGHIVFELADCMWDAPGGVYLDVDGKVRVTGVGYAESSPVDGTKTGYGTGGIGNVTPGHRTVVATLKDGTEVARRTVVVEADAVTHVRLFPSTAR